MGVETLREWVDSEPEIPSVQSEKEENFTPTNRFQKLPEIDEIINDKKIQSIIKSKQDPGSEMQVTKYEGLYLRS